MNCPVCNRSLAPTLSICPSCGAMMRDTVREEMQTKITSGRLVPQSRPYVKTEPAPLAAAAVVTAKPAEAISARLPVAEVPTPQKRRETADLAAPKTSPTLVGFHNKNTDLPDWRIQLQNAVQKRKGGRIETVSAKSAAGRTTFAAVAAAAVKPDDAAQDEPVAAKPDISDPRVASAMLRITESRNKFLSIPKPAPPPAKSYKFDVISTSGVPTAAARLNASPKPRLVSVTPSPPVIRDTNRLPPLDIRRDTELEIPDTVIQNSDTESESEFAAIKRIRIKAEHTEIDAVKTTETLIDEIEDLAQFSTRFGAGLFDLIIAGFAGMLLLSPVAFTSGEWFTLPGLLAYAGVCSIITFIYMTVCLGFYGKTMGMRLFSLELVDAVENEYPTLHQAAVSSSVFILSLAFGGVGFLTVFYNEENRAVHDLLSGTILVREF